VVAVITAAETITAIVAPGVSSVAADMAAIHRDRAEIDKVKANKEAKANREVKVVMAAAKLGPVRLSWHMGKLRQHLSSLRLLTDNTLGRCRPISTHLHHTQISGSLPP